MLFLLPSWTGPQGGDVLSLGLTCVWEWAPKGIHGHCTSYPPSNTSTVQHTQREKGCQAPCSQPFWQTGTRQMAKGIE